MRKLNVDLGANSYPIYIAREPFSKFAELLSLYGLQASLLLVTDKTVFRHHGTALKDALAAQNCAVEYLILPAGEKSKTMRSADKILTFMLEKQYDRGVCLLAFGGGVVGDLTGFVASVFKRGVSFVQVPTTFLAQVDASIGGKTAVNHPLGKNQIGTFHQPRLVWSNVEMLQTLPRREIICGLGEVIKYGVIQDEALFRFVEENLQSIFTADLDVLEEIVYRCSRIKADIVRQDERENRLRMVLNFGHTIGHAIETATNYKKISHGEAVIWGMLAEASIARAAGLLGKEDYQRLEDLCRRLRLDLREQLHPDDILHFMKADKKSHSGKVRMVLPRKIGDVLIIDEVAHGQIRSAVRGLNALL